MKEYVNQYRKVMRARNSLDSGYFSKDGTKAAGGELIEDYYVVTGTQEVSSINYNINTNLHPPDP